MKRFTLGAFALFVLAGCAGLPPSAEKLAALPVVTYPDKPGTGDFIYKLPAGKPIALNVLVDGSALVNAANQTLTASLKHDLYLHKHWASEDGQHWVPSHDLVDGNLNMTIPSYESPQPGEIHLTFNRKVAD